MHAGFQQIIEVAKRLEFEPHNIGHLTDKTGRYQQPIDREFPFLIKLFHFRSRRNATAMTWHEHLELFMPLDGPVRLRMGNQLVPLARGDMVVVDNLKLHSSQDFPGFKTRVIVVSFLPEFVYSLGSPSHDYAFLLPFYSKIESRSHVLRAKDPAAASAYRALAKLLACYFGEGGREYLEAGCKAFCLELLYHLACHFQESEVLKWEFLRQQQRSLRLKDLFDYLNRHFAEKTMVREAARRVNMSQPQFMKLFKTVAGMTFVAYVTQLRLTQATRMLKETSLSIAEIANAVGFADQSYFDRRFRRAMGVTPREFRLRATGSTAH